MKQYIKNIVEFHNKQKQKEDTYESAYALYEDQDLTFNGLKSRTVHKRNKIVND